jgi:class 3 adenylate cyclase/tetratricopeptide (TPR) repeat protein
MAPPAPGTLTTATVLFTDVVDSTAIRSRLGEELADRHYERVYKLLRGVVTAAGAIFIKSLGDGLMAAFESVAAGLDAVSEVERALLADNDRAIEEVSIRAALSVGDVRWHGHDISGLPVVEAARLVDQADGGQVLCTDLVRRLAQGRGRHEFKDLGQLPAKGLPESLHTYELRWQNADPQAERLAPWLVGGHLLPLVGRDPELEMLDAELDGAEHGTRVVILHGDPGVGKTRLASVLAERAVDRRFTVLAGRCTDPARRAYEPLAAAVDRLARESPELLLRAGVDQRCGQLVRLAPSLAEPPLSLAVPAATEPVSERYQLVAAVRTLFERLAAIRPVLLIVDDLHWATAETLQVLRTLIWDAERLPLLVLGTARPIPADAAGPAVTELRGLQADSRVVDIASLHLDDVTAALSSVRGRAVKAAGEAARLHQITGGNAFLISEVIRELADGGNLDRLTVPGSVTRMVVERLSRLGSDARSLVNLLAVGEQLNTAAWRIALGIDEAGFVAAAEELMATGLVTMSAAGLCQFSHELTRTAVYDALSPLRAGLLHGRVADALRRADPNIMDSRPYVVATHLLAAVQRDRDPARVAEAVAAVETAARDALARLAHSEAVMWYQHLVELLEEGPAAAPERLAQTLVQCGRAMWLAGSPQARATLMRAARLAGECGRTDLIVAAAAAGDRGFFSRTAVTDPERIALLTRAIELVDPAELKTKALLTAQLAAELTWAEDGERRFALSDEAVALARRSADPRTVVSVLGLRSLTIIPAESLARRIGDGEEMFEAARRTGDDLALFHATFQRIPAVLDSGDFARVAEYLDQADELARRLAQPHLVWLVSMCRTGLIIMHGDLAEAEAATTEMLQKGIAVGHRLEAMAFYAEQIAEIRRLQGRLGELRDHLRRIAPNPRIDPVHAVLRNLCELGDEEEKARAVLDKVLAEQGVIPRRDIAYRSALDNLAVAACRLGRDDLIEPLYEALASHGETFGISAVAHHCGHHYLAHLSAAGGDARRAVEHFAAAARIHERCGAPLLMAESLLDWAELADRTPAAGPSAADLRGRCAELLAGREAVLLDRRLADGEG